MANYSELEIEQVVDLAKNGDQDAYTFLLTEYEPVIKNVIKKKKLFLQGGDKDDLLQEGRIGIMKAVELFDGEKGAFFPFAQHLIKCQLVSLVMKMTTERQMILNTSYSLDRKMIAPNGEETDLDPIDYHIGQNPYVNKNLPLEFQHGEEVFIHNELVSQFYEIISEEFSEKEYKVFELHMQGYSYKTITGILGLKDKKEADNTLQRCKKKIANLRDKGLFD